MQLEEGSINLVDDTDRLDTFTQSLPEHGLGLHAHTFDTIDDNKGAVGDAECRGNLGRKVDVAGGIDQVDQEIITDDLLGDVFEILLVGHVRVQGDGGGLYSDTSILLVLSSVGKSSFAGFGG